MKGRYQDIVYENTDSGMDLHTWKKGYQAGLEVAMELTVTMLEPDNPSAIESMQCDWWNESVRSTKASIKRELGNI